MFKFIILAITAASVSTAAIAQTAQQTFDQNMRNANEVYKRQQDQQQREQQQRYNQQNGTSQYSGPTFRYDADRKAPIVGYQKSIK